MREVDGGGDGLLAVDSQVTTDAAGAGVDGSAGSSDAASPPDVPVSAPDAPEKVSDAAPTRTDGAGGASGSGGTVATGGTGAGGATGGTGGGLSIDAATATGDAGAGGTPIVDAVTATGGTATGGTTGAGDGPSGDALVAAGGTGAGGASGGTGGGPRSDASVATGGTGAGGASGGTGGASALLAIGSKCSAGSSCSSGICADGVCCNNACSGCNACSHALTGQADGSCAPVTSGLDPHDACADERGTNQCGNDGTCDGSSACHKVGTDHQCTSASCIGGSFTPVSNCNGTGACTTVTSQSCGAFQCSVTDGCKTTCTIQADCGSQSYCNTSTGSCLAKLAPGAACTQGQAMACPTGNCVDGVCCEGACTSTCMACSTTKTGASNGLCRPVKVGTDPDNECAVDTGNACGLDGTCDGVGGCRYQVLGTACGSASCTGQGMFTPRGQCNGGGTCVAGTPGSCANHMLCASTTDCATSCTDRSTTGCPSGYKCVGGNSCSIDTMTCGSTACQLGTGQVCCETIPSNGNRDVPWTYTCEDAASCSNDADPTVFASPLACGSQADCPAGQVCCATGISYDGNGSPTAYAICSPYSAARCQAGLYNWGVQFCDPNNPSECVTGSCTSFASYVHGTYACQ